MSKIVEAVGISVRSSVAPRAKMIEEAMSQAVLACSAEGITDPDVVRARMQEAREDAKKRYQVTVEKATAAAKKAAAESK